VNEQTAIHRRVERLRSGTDPTLIARLPSGWAVFGEQQFLRGYALLLPDPVVPDLNSLAGDTRMQFLRDLAGLGDALLTVTGALRINYAIFGNLEPALHAHLVPRYREEDPVLATAHPWAYDWPAAPSFLASDCRQLLGPLRAALNLSARSAGVGPSST
jgi:diadenosine tetraphosphate (Ap4A) HIT family hydrolase